jgi:hypothetical protein
LGYSNTGVNGEYGLAMTMDGAIVADFITAGILKGVRVQTTDNKVYLTDGEGIIANKGKIGAWNISEDTDTVGALYSDSSFNGDDWRVWINQAQKNDDTWIFSVQKKSASENGYWNVCTIYQNGRIAATGDISTSGSVSAGGGASITGNITTNKKSTNDKSSGNIVANGDITALNGNMFCRYFQADDSAGIKGTLSIAEDENDDGGNLVVANNVTAQAVYANNDGAGSRQCVTCSSNGTVFVPDSLGFNVWIDGTWAGRLLYG